MKIKQKFNIDYEYEVVFTHNLFCDSNNALKELLGEKSSKAIFFIDAGVDKAFPSLKKDIIRWSKKNPGVLDLRLPIQIVEGGEKIKNNFSVVENLCDAMTEAGICRHSYCFIIGGGAVLDAVGFAAAIFHRGVNQIRIPTTVLSQDDSGVGVKNAINHNGVKNLFGTFAPPVAVINDSLFLTALSKREILSGIAEAIKVSIIKDEDFFYYIKNNAEAVNKCDMMVLETIIYKSAQIHMQHICGAGDPFEKGSSRPLDFGHWSAHKLESITNHKVKHGEAVAMGICLDAYIAVAMNLISVETGEEIIDTFKACGFNIWHEELEARDSHGQLLILKGLREFQEHLGGELTLAMPTKIGSITNIHEMPENIVEGALSQLKEVATTQ
jgi:3-dehydroquinate synthase